MSKKWWNPATWGTKDASIEDVIGRLSLLGKTVSGEAVTEETALQSPTFYAAVQAISRTIAQLPLDVIEKDGKNRNKRPDHDLYKLLSVRPNEWQSRYEYWSNVGTSLLMHNVFYAYKNQAPNGRILNLHPLHPSRVTPKQGDDMRLTYDVTYENGEIRKIPPEKMHRICMFSLDGVKPVSPLVKLRESIGLEIAAEKYGAGVFESAAVPNVVIKRPGHFKDQSAFDRFKDSWNNAFSKKGGTAILEDGFDIEKVQMTAEESQFLETRKLQRNVLAGAMNITPHRVGELGRATFNNVEHLGLEYVNYTIMPYLLAIETAIVRDLVSEKEQERISVKFNVDSLLRGDSKTRAEALKIRREWGIISADEWRAYDDLNPLPDDKGSDYLVPLNYTVAGEDKPEAEPKGPAPSFNSQEDDDNA